MKVLRDKDIKEYLLKALDLARRDSEYRKLAAKFYKEAGCVPLDKRGSEAWVVIDENNIELTPMKDDEWYPQGYIVGENKEIFEELKETILTDNSSNNSELIEIASFLSDLPVTRDLIDETTIEADEVTELQKEVDEIITKVESAIRNTVKSWSVLPEKKVEIRSIYQRKESDGTINIDGEIQYGNDIVAYASIRSKDNDIILDTVLMDMLQKEYKIKKYKLGSKEGYAPTEDDFLKSVIADTPVEVKPIHIVGNDLDSRITFWKIEEEDGKYVLKRLDVQSLLE